MAHRTVDNDATAPSNVVVALTGSAPARNTGRAWDGVEAMRFRPSSREVAVPALSNHLVVLHLGPTVEIAQGLDGGRVDRRLIRGGSSAVIPAGQPSEWRWGEQEQGRADSLHLYLTPALVREAAESMEVDPDRVEIVGNIGTVDRQIERIGLSFLPELDARPSLGSGLFGDSLAKALAVHLLRAHSSIERRAASREPSGRLAERALKRAIDYVEMNLPGDLLLAEIARAASMSPFHFSRLFKESTGLSPYQYVIARRVELARGLLTGTDLPLHEVAEAAGFSDQSHMGRHIKRLVGVSPARLRRG